MLEIQTVENKRWKHIFSCGSVTASESEIYFYHEKKELKHLRQTALKP